MTPQELAVAIADVVQDHVSLSVAPLLSDVKLLQAQVSAWEARWNDLGALRERVAVVEAKSAVSATAPIEPHPVDLSPVLERVAACEAKLSTLGDLRDRVVTVETKSAQPLPPVDFSVVTARLDVVEKELTVIPLRVMPLIDSVAEHTKDLGTIRERLAVVETRPPVPGPKGDPGEPGKDGKDGAPGLAGLSYEGVYQDGKSYDVGQLTTWAGSTWHCNEPTMTKPGDGSKAWTLIVKRGRDGRDGVDAPSVPVVAVGRR